MNELREFLKGLAYVLVLALVVLGLLWMLKVAVEVTGIKP